MKATQLMMDVVKDGGAPKAVTTYMEPESLTAFQTGKYTYMRNWPRPVSPVYPQISQAIYKNVNQALAGQISAQDAMKQAQSDIDKALSTF